jgi:alpha-glucosidase
MHQLGSGFLSRSPHAAFALASGEPIWRFERRQQSSCTVYPFRALVLHLAVIAAALPAFSATPASGSLSGSAATVNWSGGPYTAVATDTSSCTTLNCDTFYLTINTPSGFFASLPKDEVQIRITWLGATNEFDLYLFDPSGNVLASSAQFLETYEEIDAGPLPNGTYKVVVVAWQTVNVLTPGQHRSLRIPRSPMAKRAISRER